MSKCRRVREISGGARDEINKNKERKTLQLLEMNIGFL